MKMTALTGTVLALVLAAAPMATTAHAAQTAPTSAAIAGVSNAPFLATAPTDCRVIHFWDGRWHRHGRVICTHIGHDGNHHFPNHDNRFGHNQANDNARDNGNSKDNGDNNGNGNGPRLPHPDAAA